MKLYLHPSGEGAGLEKPTFHDMIGVKMGWTGEICRRPEAFWHFRKNREADVRSRRALELERDFPHSGIDQFTEEPSTATARDVELRKIFERERYAELVFSGKPRTPVMIKYGRERLGKIIDIGRLKRAA